MAGLRRRGRASLPHGDRRQGVRHALLHTFPGRAIVIGLVTRLFVYAVGLALGSLPPFLAVVDTVAGVALAAGAAYFVFQLFVIAKQRLLWRVRRKLILSYFFIGFMPALLIVAFFLLSGFLLFYNFGSYLVQSRLRALGDRARFIAEGTVLEIERGGPQSVADIIRARERDQSAQSEGLSIAVVPADRSCGDGSARQGRPPAVGPVLTAGPWAHVATPSSIPSWIACRGFAGLLAYSTPRPTGTGDGTRSEDTHMLVRGVAFPVTPRPAYGVIVDLPVAGRLTQQLRQETGVALIDVIAVHDAAGSVKPIAGRPAESPGRAAQPASRGILGNVRSLFEYRDWTSGDAATLYAVTDLDVSELYDRISSTQGLGHSLLLVLYIIGGLFLVIEGVALVAGLMLAKSITGSVHELFAGTEQVRQGDFTHRIAVSTDDQLGELSLSFNSMTASIEDLLRQAEEKKRLEEELRIARQIQMSLLPQGPFVMPGLTVTALCVPAREVGGDYYDFFRLGERRLGLLIADVSGKGTSAAFYMAELKGLMLSLSRIHTSPRELLLAADRIIAANLDGRSFITMTYAVIDLDEGTMRYARAGHTPLIYVPAKSADCDGGVRVLAPDGQVLGLNLDNGEMFERILEEQTIDLHAGDLAVFFTDGITEAMNEADDCFGEARLGRLAEEHAHLPSEELRERVLREVEAFVGGAPQHDDMTMILLKVEQVGAVPSPLAAEPAEIAGY